MVDYSEKKLQLRNIYKIWADEIKEKAPEFLSNKYSNPYYTSIPDNWYENKNRIFVVGEEGFGSGKDENEKFDDFDSIQNFNKEYMILNLVRGKGYNKSPFWNRIRKINELAPMSITWGNSDKIHILDDKSCALSDDEKHKLHSINCNILQEEINILEPSIVILFGWYYVSMSYDMKQHYEDIVKNYEKDWKSPFIIINNNVPHIFTIHPRCGQMQRGYEDKVLELVKKYIK